MKRTNIGKILLILISFYLLFSTSTTFLSINVKTKNSLLDLEWQYLGGPAGGIGYDIRIDPKNPNIMYVTDNSAGIFKSTDYGNTWFSINAGIETKAGFTGDSVPVFSVTIDPNKTDTLWLGTQNISGIYKSENGGETWERKISGIEEHYITFRGFSIDPNNSNIVYAAGEIPSHEWARQEFEGFAFDKTKGTIYRTLNGGDDWVKIWEGENLARYVWIDPSDSNRIWASTGIFDRNASNASWENKDPGGVGVIYSEDFGKTWVEFNSSNGLTGLYVGSLDMNPKDPDTLIAGTGSDEWSNDSSLSPRGVYITHNGGKEWEKVKTIRTIISAVEFCDADPDIVYAAGEPYFFKSEDGGQTWIKKGDYLWGAPGRKAGIPIDVVCDQIDTDKVFVNSYNGGNIVTYDGGETWQNASKGYSGSEIFSIKVNPENPAEVYITSLEGFAVSYDYGESWIFRNKIGVDFTHSGGFLVIDQSTETILSSFQWNTLIYKTTNGGLDWNKAFGSERNSNNGIIDYAQNPFNNQIIFAISRATDQGIKNYPEFLNSESLGLGLLKSSNLGKTWTIDNDGLPEDKNINAITFDYNQAGKVIIGTVSGGVFISVDDGATWSASNSGLQGNDVRALEISPNKSDTIFASIVNKGVFKSVDGGETWVRSSNGLNPDSFVVDIEVNPTDKNEVWLADFFSGIYVSTDGGENWIQHNQNLTNRAVTSIEITSDGNYIYAGTAGAGVFRLGTLPELK